MEGVGGPEYSSESGLCPYSWPLGVPMKAGMDILTRNHETVLEYLRGRIPEVEYAGLEAGGHGPRVNHPDLLAASLGAFWRS